MKSLNKQSNFHFQYSILVDNSQDKIWGFLTNVERWKEWDTELKSSTISGEFALGVKGFLTSKKGSTLKFHISKITTNKSYTFVTKMPVGTLEIERSLVKKDDLIEFTDDIKFTGFLKRFFGLILGGGFKSVLPRVMENFK